MKKIKPRLSKQALLGIIHATEGVLADDCGPNSQWYEVLSEIYAANRWARAMLKYRSAARVPNRTNRPR
jgi:hypothetical protein